MDLYCPICGESWDFDTLHEEAGLRYGIPYYLEGVTGYDFEGPQKKIQNPSYNSDEYQKVYKQVSAEFRMEGCRALKLFNGTDKPEWCKKETADADRDRTFGLTRSEASAALYDLLGDDMDGAAAMLDDMGF